MKDEGADRLVTLAISSDIVPLGEVGYLTLLEDGTSVFLKDRDGAGKEVLAYQISRDLGFDLVPPTGLREVEIDGRRRTVAVQPALCADPRVVDVPPLEHFSEADLLNAAIFDTLVLAVERESKNWAGRQGSPYWQLILYDHDDFFGDRGFCGSDLRRRMIGTPIPPEIVARLTAYERENYVPPRRLHSIGGGYMVDVLDRLRALVRNPVITREPWERDGGITARERHRLARQTALQEQAAQQARDGAKR